MAPASYSLALYQLDKNKTKREEYMNTNIYRSCCKYETLRYVLETQFDLTPQF